MPDTIDIRPYRPGDPSLVCYAQMKFYGEVHGFGQIFEYYLTKGMSEFLANPAGGQLWIAEQDSRMLGSIAIVRQDADTAQLRWVLVDDSVQGQGLGRRLAETAVQFCKEQGYRRVILWTASMLLPARSLYASLGFSLVETKDNTGWTSHVVTEEKWELEL